VNFTGFFNARQWSPWSCFEAISRTDMGMADYIRAEPSEHRVLICREAGHALQNVPVLDDPAIFIEPEDVDASPLAVAGPALIAAQRMPLPRAHGETRRACPDTPWPYA
jgi:hypothetical protein